MSDLQEQADQCLLVIDDNPSIHVDFRKIFPAARIDTEFDEIEALLIGASSTVSKRPHFEIDSALQGQEGLKLVQESLAKGRPYAMAFVDVRMPPGWDGIETVAKIWEIDPNLQVVICTAYADYSWEEMHKKLGHSDRLVILKKPFDTIEVVQLAGALTEKWRLLQQSRTHLIELEDRVVRRTEELRKSEERFRLITENAADLIGIIDAHERRIYSSPSYEKLLGYSSLELSSVSAFAQVHPDDRQNVLEAIQQILTSGIGQVLEYRMQHKDGSWRTLESHGVPFRNTAGVTEGVLVVARDISERKMLEVQLRHAQKLESIGQLAAGIAHEINTPTQFIGDNTRFLRDAFGDLQTLLSASDDLLRAALEGKLTPELIAKAENARQTSDLDYLANEIPKAIEQTINGVERVTKIVRAMKEFSHPGTDHKTLIDLNYAIESTITVCRNEWKYVADLVTDFEPNLTRVPVLPGEFNQVILNLIVNAAHAIAEKLGEGSKGKGVITISTRNNGRQIEIRIQDTGTGIPEKVREQVFNPFFTTKGVGKGTGQGLAIARSVIVDKHGGTITFETRIGEGTCFIISLPLTESEV